MYPKQLLIFDTKKLKYLNTKRMPKSITSDIARINFEASPVSLLIITWERP